MTTRAEEIAGEEYYTQPWEKEEDRQLFSELNAIAEREQAAFINGYKQGQQDRWISVEERLPEKNEVVFGVGVKWTRVDLVIHGDCEDYGPDTIIGEDSPTETLWRWHSDGTPIRDSNVTHWMSLPPNPEQR